MDETDRQIISALSQNANIPHAELAGRLNVTRQTVAARIKRLQREGVIKKYKAVIDYDKVGLKSFFILFLKLDVTDQKKAASFISTLKRDPHVLMDVSITGEWDVMLMLAFEDVKDYETYTNVMRAKMGTMIKDSKSHVVLNFYKTPDDYVPP
jgi:DNA-binding Lrp family transcriptional regulator